MDLGPEPPSGRLSMKSNAFPLKQILVLVFAYLLPANLHAQVTISASNAAGVALTSAAKYRFIQDNAWKDYEDVVIISMLNGIAKMSATSSVPASTADYTSAANQVRAWLDGRPPQDPALLTDH